jgi:hypothetical protein
MLLVRRHGVVPPFTLEAQRLAAQAPPAEAGHPAPTAGPRPAHDRAPS